MFNKSVKDKFSILNLGDTNEEKVQNRDASETIEEKVMNFSSKEKVSSLKPERDHSFIEERHTTNDQVINKNKRLRIYKPTHYEVVQSIGKDIKDGKIVLLDMNSLDEKTAIKIIQFISGVCYALDIEPEDASPKVISIDPQNKI